jgi:hypothetical protein
MPCSIGVVCGRRIIALGTLSCLSLFGMGVALSPNIGSVSSLIYRMDLKSLE